MLKDILVSCHYSIILFSVLTKKEKDILSIILERLVVVVSLFRHFHVTFSCQKYSIRFEGT